MIEKLNSSPEPIRPEQSFQLFMLGRQVLMQQGFPDGYGMMETLGAIWRKADEQDLTGFEGILVNEFQAYPNATAIELGASPVDRQADEWNDNVNHADPRPQTRTKVEEQMSGAIAEISYWGANDINMSNGEDNPSIIYYYLRAENTPTKTVEYLGSDGKMVVVEGLEVSGTEANLVLLDLANALEVAKSQ